jgi:hypothetical protein
MRGENRLAAATAATISTTAIIWFIACQQQHFLTSDPIFKSIPLLFKNLYAVSLNSKIHFTGIIANQAQSLVSIPFLKGTWKQGNKGKDKSTLVKQMTCDHSMHDYYTRKRFDILNELEISETKCLNCHKILILGVKKLKTGKRE